MPEVQKEVRASLDGPTYERLRKAAALHRVPLGSVVKTLIAQGIKVSDQEAARG